MRLYLCVCALVDGIDWGFVTSLCPAHITHMYNPKTTHTGELLDQIEYQVKGAANYVEEGTLQVGWGSFFFLFFFKCISQGHMCLDGKSNSLFKKTSSRSPTELTNGHTCIHIQWMQVQGAIQHAKKARKYQCCMLICTLVAVGILVLVLFVFKKNIGL